MSKPSKDPRDSGPLRVLTPAETEAVSGGSAVLVGIGPVVITAGSGPKRRN
jgi:hypothetical protein